MYKIILQEICDECQGEGSVFKYESTPEDCFGRVRPPFCRVSCYICKGDGYVYEESHMIPELKERIILNFEKEA